MSIYGWTPRIPGLASHGVRGSKYEYSLIGIGTIYGTDRMPYLGVLLTAHRMPCTVMLSPANVRYYV